MGIYRNIKEHLSVDRSRQDNGAAAAMIFQLCYLMQDNAIIRDLTLSAEGAVYRYSGRGEVTAEFRDLLIAMNRALRFDLTAEYSSISASGLREHMEGLHRRELKGTFYSLYIRDDCSSGAGSVYAYGEKNGVFYHGAVPYRPMDSLPEGFWVSPVPAVVCAPDDLSGGSIRRIRQICSRIRSLGGAPEAEESRTSLSDNSLSFHLDRLSIRSQEDLGELLRLYGLLREYTGGECSLSGSFVSLEGPDPRVLRVGMDKKGRRILELCAA